MLALAAVLAGCAEAPEQRMWLDAKINGTPVRLFADTGSSTVMLLHDKAKELGLATTVRNGVNFTDSVTLDYWGTTIHLPLFVDTEPSYVNLGTDGVLGWAQMQGKLLRFDADTRQIVALDKLPDDVASWTKLQVRPSLQIMTLEVPQADGGPPGLIFVDTGNPGGVGLPPVAWALWRDAHPKDPATLRIFYTPSARKLTESPLVVPISPGTVIVEEMWAHEISLGTFTMTETPISQSDPATTKLGGTRQVATFGMAALRRLDFVFDGIHNCVYLRPRMEPPTPYLHNRLGAVFTPMDDINEFLIAHVEPGGPAARAGLRDGDTITAINRQTKLNWLKHPDMGMANFEWPWISAIYFQVWRNNDYETIGVPMENILGPKNY
ncbi:MAG TPA: PDZ domain-containing protein [Opitutales bacterium]|nr:PDZ domain-containing protein [Opitutales bacterium]